MQSNYMSANGRDSNKGSDNKQKSEIAPVASKLLLRWATKNAVSLITRTSNTADESTRWDAMPPAENLEDKDLSKVAEQRRRIS